MHSEFVKLAWWSSASVQPISGLQIPHQWQPVMWVRSGQSSPRRPKTFVISRCWSRFNIFPSTLSLFPCALPEDHNSSFSIRSRPLIDSHVLLILQVDCLGGKEQLQGIVCNPNFNGNSRLLWQNHQPDFRPPISNLPLSERAFRTWAPGSSFLLRLRGPCSICGRLPVCSPECLTDFEFGATHWPDRGLNRLNEGDRSFLGWGKPTGSKQTDRVIDSFSKLAS